MTKKVYVLTVSQVFPKTHRRAGEPTDFIKKIVNGEKAHTIRSNYELWRRRAIEINAGRAILSVRVWEGKPYNSKQHEVFVYEEIGVEKIQFDAVMGIFINDIDSRLTVRDLALNDGLSFEDFKEWFKGYDLKEPMAVIHFSIFRYEKFY